MHTSLLLFTSHFSWTTPASRSDWSHNKFPDIWKNLHQSIPAGYPSRYLTKLAHQSLRSWRIFTLSDFLNRNQGSKKLVFYQPSPIQWVFWVLLGFVGSGFFLGWTNFCKHGPTWRVLVFLWLFSWLIHMGFCLVPTTQNINVSKSPIIKCCTINWITFVADF